MRTGQWLGEGATCCSIPFSQLHGTCSSSRSRAAQSDSLLHSAPSLPWLHGIPCSAVQAGCTSQQVHHSTACKLYLSEAS